MSKTSATDKQNLEHKVIDAINEFLNKDEFVQMYLEDELESVQDIGTKSKAMTSLEMEVYSQNMAAIKMKLLAKVIGAL